MRPASFGAVSPPDGRDCAVENEGDKMRAHSLSELFHLTRAELFALYYRIADDLPSLSDLEYEIALENLRRIRRVLSHYGRTPSC
jgi:hypothetical protein